LPALKNANTLFVGDPSPPTSCGKGVSNPGVLKCQQRKEVFFDELINEFGEV
jgi:hypothetical protein